MAGRYREAAAAPSASRATCSSPAAWPPTRACADALRERAAPTACGSRAHAPRLDPRRRARRGALGRVSPPGARPSRAGVSHDGPLAGQVAAVTGGSGGIGTAIVGELAAAGASRLLARPDGAGVAVDWIRRDVRDERSVEAAIAELDRRTDGSTSSSTPPACRATRSSGRCRVEQWDRDPRRQPSRRVPRSAGTPFRTLPPRGRRPHRADRIDQRLAREVRHRRRTRRARPG